MRKEMAPLQPLAYWMKKNLFSSTGNTVITIVLFCLLAKVTMPLFEWLVVNSIWQGDALTCRQAEGACLAFVREKFLFILFGFYPREFLWRPILAIALFLLFVWWSKELKRWNKHLLWQWPLLYGVCAFLLIGGAEMDKWGGLVLTLILSSIGFIFSYPLGVLLALGRQSHLPVIRLICIVYIELIRGVPLISLLFMASVMFPLFLPEGMVLPKLLRAQMAIIMFVSAYLAEVVRGGLAAVPQGQYEACDALGLSYWKKMGLVILPQALKIVIPPTVNVVISMFKNTSLVVIIALFDLLMTTKTSLQDADWLGFSVEGYVFVGLVYFIFCFSMGRYGRRLERELNREVRL